MDKRLLWLLPALCTASACGGGAAEAPATAKVTDAPVAAAPAYSLPDDLEIAGKVYDTSYSAPAGFFVDERATTASSYTVHHVTDPSGAFEICSDDFAAAEALEADDNASRAVQGYYVGAVETERYFEFVRELAYTDSVGNITTPTSPGYARVYKCANTSRDGVDRSSFEGFAGHLNKSPRRAADFRVFAEYLWQFTFLPVRQKKVLASIADESPTTLGRTLVIALGINQGSGRCDRIEVVNWRFELDRETGRVEQRFDTVREFEARNESGSPSLCN